MKKKMLIDIISYLEEFIYRNKNSHESILTLAHFYYLQGNKDNFFKNIDLFIKSSKNKNLGDLEKLYVNDESFEIVLQEELYSNIENNYKQNDWDEEFIEKCILFSKGLDEEYYLKPYFLCELLINNKKKEFEQAIISQIIEDYPSSKWELTGLNIYTKGLLKRSVMDFDSKEDKLSFLDKSKEDFIFFLTKYNADDRAQQNIFSFIDILKGEKLYDEVLKILARISDIVKGESAKLRIFYEMGIVYFLTGKKNKAIQIFSDFFANFETSRELLEIKFKAAIFLKEKGLYKNSYLIFKDIGERFKTSSWAILCSKNILEIARMFFDENDYKEAIFFLDEVLKLKNNRDDVSSALYFKAKSCENLAEDSFSYDEKKRFSKDADYLYKKIVKNYNDNHKILSNIPSKYLEEKKGKRLKLDLGYIFFVFIIIVITTFVLLKLI